MLLCIKQHLSNIWSSIHEKVKQHWGWVEKKVLFIKKRVLSYTERVTIFYNLNCESKYQTNKIHGKAPVPGSLF